MSWKEDLNVTFNTAQETTLIKYIIIKSELGVSLNLGAVFLALHFPTVHC